MTGLSSETLLNALEACEMHKTMAVHFRPYGAFDISIDQDNWARRFQRRDRQAEKVRKALLAKAAAQEARIRELEAQAERDAEVREAAKLLCDARQMFTLSPGPNATNDTIAAFGVYKECERILDAALAASKKGE